MTNRERAFNIVGDYTPLHTSIEQALNEAEGRGRAAGLAEAEALTHALDIEVRAQTTPPRSAPEKKE